VLVNHVTLAVDDERFGRAVDTPIDRCPAIQIGTDRRKWIAVAPEKSPRCRRLILVIDAVDIDAGRLFKLLDQRMLIDALTTEILPFARSAEVKPGSGLPCAVSSPSTGGKVVCGTGFPTSVDGSSDGSPDLSATAKNPAMTTKSTTGSNRK
jgi:hypothetical protein